MSATGDPRQAGTTLIEALVVVAITALVALAAFPRLQQSLLALAQRQTVTLVAARLRAVRADALRLDRPMMFAVGADGRRYGEPGGALAATPPGVVLSSRPGGTIAFYGDGSSSGGSLWVSAARRSVRVWVAPASGAVMVGGG